MTGESGKRNDDPAPFSAQDAMAFMQKMWNPFAMPMPMPGSATPTDAAASGARATAQVATPGIIAGAMPGMLSFPNPAAMFAALDPAEVERKIGELRIIEGWLGMSIKTLELQRAALEALHAGRAPAKAKREAKRRRG